MTTGRGVDEDGTFGNGPPEGRSGQDMVSTVWTRSLAIDTLAINPEKRLGLVGLLRLLQDIAWVHGGHLGLGFEAMAANGHLWVLARQKLVAEAWPVWGDSIDIRTWVRPPEGMFVHRDFEVIAAGRRVAIATANWIVLDAVRRRPVRFAAGDLADGAWRGEPLSLDPQKLPLPAPAAACTSFDVRYSDLDVNGHVNNTRYAGWALDALPPERLAGRTVADYEVNFLAEAGIGDRVDVSWAEDSPDVFSVRGDCAARGKTVFTSVLRLAPA